MEVQLTGVNNTSFYKKLEYKIKWLDNNGLFDRYCHVEMD